MKLPEIDFSSLEVREIGSWPLILRIGVIIVIMIVASVGLYFVLLANEFAALDAAEKKLNDKKTEFKTQYNQAINVDAYKAQMQEMEVAYNQYLKELPSSSNIPDLIDSITKIGDRVGVRINYVKIGDPKLLSDFYMALPLTLNLTGTYHNFGLFISDISKLARIVTLGDFNIKPISSKGGDGVLEMNMSAQTYWLATANEIKQNKPQETKKSTKKTTTKSTRKLPSKSTGEETE